MMEVGWIDSIPTDEYYSLFLYDLLYKEAGRIQLYSEVLHELDHESQVNW
jgi:hypothetical protein